MLLRIFKENQLPSLLLHGFLLALVFVSGMVSIHEDIFPVDPVFPDFVNVFFTENAWVGILINYVFLFLLSLGINYAAVQLNLFERPTSLPGVLFSMFILFHPDNLLFSSLILVALLLILTWFSLNPELDGSIQYIFYLNAGLFSGLAVILYFPLFPWVLFSIFSLLIFNVFSVRKMLISIIGLLIPLLYTFTYLYWFDLLEIYWQPEVWFAVGIPSVSFKTNEDFTVFLTLGLIVLFTVWAIGSFFLASFRLKILQRRRYQILSLMLVMVLILSFHQQSAFPRHLSLAAFPASIFVAQLLLSSRIKWLGDFFILSLLFLICVNHWVKFLA